jgi:hypothetical protein
MCYYRYLQIFVMYKYEQGIGEHAVQWNKEYYEPANISSV